LETFQGTNPDAYRNSRQAQRNSQGRHTDIDKYLPQQCQMYKKSLVSVMVQETTEGFMQQTEYLDNQGKNTPIQSPIFIQLIKKMKSQSWVTISEALQG
jgi:hypothetical protein